MIWKKIRSTKLFSHPRISIYEDDVVLPGGIKSKYLHFGEQPDTAVVIAKNSEDKFLVQKEYSYPPNEVLFQFPGGQIENGESQEDGACRELAEEAGLSGKLEFLGWFYSHNRRSKQKMHVYLASDLTVSVAQKDLEENFQDFWFTQEEIESHIRTNEFRNFSLLAAWALYLAHKK